jgi:hypothetical protein
VFGKSGTCRGSKFTAKSFEWDSGVSPAAGLKAAGLVEKET